MLTLDSVTIDGKAYADVRAGLDAVAADLERVPERAAPKVSAAIRRVLDQAAEAMRARHSEAWRPGGSPPDRLFSRSGSGLRGLIDSVRVDGAGADLTGSITAPATMARHEEGATIRPKRAKMLAVPLPAALDSRGLPVRQSPRDWDRTFIRRSKRGNLLIFRREGRRLVPLYVLKDSVTLPARLGLRGAVQAGLGWFEDALAETVTDAICGRL